MSYYCWLGMQSKSNAALESEQMVVGDQVNIDTFFGSSEACKRRSAAVITSLLNPERLFVALSHRLGDVEAGCNCRLLVAPEIIAYLTRSQSLQDLGASS